MMLTNCLTLLFSVEKRRLSTQVDKTTRFIGRQIRINLLETSKKVENSRKCLSNDGKNMEMQLV